MVNDVTIGLQLFEMGLEPIFTNSSDVDILPYGEDFICRRMGYFNP
jgi:hypothetical protein